MTEAGALARGRELEVGRAEGVLLLRVSRLAEAEQNALRGVKNQDALEQQLVQIEDKFQQVTIAQPLLARLQLEVSSITRTVRHLQQQQSKRHRHHGTRNPRALLLL